MGHHHISRREVLKSIQILTAGSVLLPACVLFGEPPDTRTPGVIRGSLIDGATGRQTTAKLRVTELTSGEPYFPAGSIKTMPQRAPVGVKHYFYARNSYEIAVPPGRYKIEAVRGIEHEAAIEFVEVGAGMTRVEDITIPLLVDTHERGWYSGNTHTHYQLEMNEDPDDHLRMVPPAEALDVSVISYLVRSNSPYITNKYPVGRLPEFSRNGTLMDMGEEARNNKASGDGDVPNSAIGYGHCLFLNIPHLVEPVSTGLLFGNGKGPDFPLLSMLCAEAQKIGGTTVWCHNGSGMEMPIAVAQGLVNAYNVADGSNADYTNYYRILNCGIRLPASTGTDWWIYDHNRVFVKVEGPFTYDSWIAGLRAGRTFVSNGPLLDLSVNERGPGHNVDTSGLLRISARAVSRVPFERLEIVCNGVVVAEESAIDQREAKLEREIVARRSGWVAARVSGDTKTRAEFRVFAHTSPVYFKITGISARQAEAAGELVDEIEESMRFIRKNYRFANDADKALAMGRFEQGRQFYARLISGND